MRKIYSFLQSTLCKPLSVFLLITLFSGSLFAANTVTINGGMFNYGTIQAAVNAASDGDIIDVSAGTYNESVTVTKSLTILGPNNNISPNGGVRLAEATIVPVAPDFRAFEVYGINKSVVIKGFKIINGSPLHDGNHEPPYTVNMDIIFKNNYTLNGNIIYGGYFWKSISIVDNKFENIIGTAIFLVGGDNITITDNTISATGAGILVNGDRQPISQVSIMRNTVRNTAEGIQLAKKVVNATISENVVDNATQSGGIHFFDLQSTGSGNVSVRNNIITNSKYGVYSTSNIGNQNVSITNNSIDQTNVIGIFNAGTGTLQATCNWFGSDPPAPSSVVGAVNYNPWLVSGFDTDAAIGFQPAPGTCFGGTPQTDICGYTIYAFKKATIGDNSIVHGSLGVRDAKGKVEFKKNSTLADPGTFAKAAEIKVSKDANVPNVIEQQALVNLPAMQQYHGSANAPDVKVPDNAMVSLNGNNYGKIEIGKGAKVTFTESSIDVKEIEMKNNDKTPFSEIIFTSAATSISVRVAKKVKIEENCKVNTTATKPVTFYLNDAKRDEEKFDVHGGSTTFVGNVFLPDGKMHVHGEKNEITNMTGIFIAEEIEGDGKYVVWNHGECNSLFAPFAPPPVAVIGTVEVEELAKNFNVNVTPNPTRDVFKIKVQSANHESVTIKLIDAAGRPLQVIRNVEVNTTVTAGEKLQPGNYFAEIIQGNQRKVVKLIKMN